MTTLPLPVGPVGVLQVIPVTPAISQVPLPVAGAPPTCPVTVAVKVKESPKFAVEAEVVTTTVGVPLATVIGKAVLGPTAR